MWSLEKAKEAIKDLLNGKPLLCWDLYSAHQKSGDRATETV